MSASATQQADDRPDVWSERDELRRLAAEAAGRLERLRETVANYRLTTAYDYRADGVLIERLKRASGLETSRP